MKGPTQLRSDDKPMAPTALKSAMKGVDRRFRVELQTNRLYHFWLN